jgi:hypothetical protein
MALTGRKLLLALAVFVVGILLAALAITLSGPPTRSPLPNPNGYNDFLKAAAVLTGDVGNASTLAHDDLRALVSTNAESLRLLRLGLTRGCSAPTDSAMRNVPGMMSDLASFKSLARLLEEEGRLAEMENRYGDAAHSYLDTIRLGNAISRGGFIINRLVGIACEAIGLGPLAKLVPKLKPDEARSLITALERIDAGHVTWAEVVRNERSFARHQLRNTLNPIPWVVGWWQSRQAMEKTQTKHKTVIAHERLLAAELALRCYQSEKATVPTRLDELATNYLAKVPQDPFTGQPLIYRPQGTNWLLYSVGRDGVDDGGKPVSRGSAKGDIFLDSPW